MPPSIYRLCPPSSLGLPLILYRGLLLGEIHGRVSSSARSTTGQAHPAHAALHGIAVPADLLSPRGPLPQRATLHGTSGSRSPTRRDPWLASSAAEPTSRLSDRAEPLELLRSEEVGAGTQIHGAPNARKQSLQAAKSANSGHGGKIIQNPHSHRASLNGDEMSYLIFLSETRILDKKTFFKSVIWYLQSILPRRSGEVNLTLGGIDLKLPQRSGEVNLTFWEFTVRASTPRHHRALAYLPTHDFLPTNGALAKTLDALLWPRSPFPTASWRPKTAPFPLPACACCPNRRRDRRTCSLPATSRCPQPFSVPLSRLQARVVSLAPDAHLVNKVQTKKAPAPKIAKQESSDDDTSDETSESDEEPAKKPTAKPLVVVAKNGSKTVKQESSSDEDSSKDESNDDSDDEPAKKAAAKPLGVVAKNGLKKGKQETSSDETSSDDESDDDVKPAAPLKKTYVVVAQKKKGYSSESDSDDDSDEEVPPKSKAPAATIKKEDSSETESESDSEVEDFGCDEKFPIIDDWVSHLVPDTRI
ncbi:hypothetical protein Zm00014a_001670 [Zea mays]|uniref:Nucleolin 2 n=1 Tax=Zea mays TaxID=4577 RepID=A0A317YEJ1_MAIZE|nr:hypothetical protein Zm00014a_001670 [Zea mays]